MKETLFDKIFSNFFIHTPKDTKTIKNVVLAKDVKECFKDILEDIEKKIIWWENLIKEKKYKDGSLRATRIYIIIEELKSIQNKIIKKRAGEELTK